MAREKGISAYVGAEIEYRAWTNDGKLRHASYKGLREGQDNADIYALSDSPEGDE